MFFHRISMQVSHKGLRSVYNLTHGASARECKNLPVASELNEPAPHVLVGSEGKIRCEIAIATSRELVQSN